MPRNFNGSSDVILMSLGSVPTSITNVSLVAIVNLEAVSRWNNIISLLTSGDALGLDMTVNNSNQLSAEFSAGIRTTIGSIGTGWQLLALTKASGTNPYNGYRYVYSTNTWTGPTASSNAGNPSGTIARPYLGAIASTDFIDGDIAIAGVWTRALATAEVQNLAFSLTHWYASNPVALWVLDQASTGQKIADRMGAAHESTLTGTSVSTASVPVFGYGHDFELTKQPAAGDVIVNATPGIINLGATAPVLRLDLPASPGILTLTATDPAIREDIPAPPGILNLTATDPAVTYSGTVTGTPGILSLTATDAVVNTGTVVNGTPGVLNLTATDPVIREDIPAPPGILNLTSTAPSVNTGTTVTGTVGILVLNGGNQTLEGDIGGGATLWERMKTGMGL